ncbi:uncharacterized protein B0H18DRAFT_958979 [Fomitopsis serialis]|uniref:uncharacterized protein n=1 Tax=Fomitopsis serialis TaxID=139415 RepID=UPI0020076BC6|nr:uncharacterized protein B0H18DRAFT_958979 [Neoantrodia serialis]KAH9916148.1 hypothetical protein B0H18DRAFT_958979 [Neoantrodia serialis]
MPNGPSQAANSCPEAGLGPQSTGRNADPGQGLITRSGMARHGTLNQRPNLCLEIPPGPLAPPSPCLSPRAHDLPPSPSPVMPPAPTSKKRRGRKTKADQIEDPAETEGGNAGLDTGVKSKSRVSRSSQEVDPDLQELAKEIKNQKRAEQTAFEAARENEIANPTIWLPSGKKRERKASEVGPSPTASTVKRGRVMSTESFAASPPHKPATDSDSISKALDTIQAEGQEVGDTDQDVEMAHTNAAEKKPAGSVSASEQEQDSEDDLIQSDAGREQDEDFGVEYEPAISQRKAEKIAQQLKQGTATLVSKAETRRDHKSRNDLTDHDASTGTDSEYKADFLDDDDSSACSQDHESGDSDPVESAEASDERVPDPAWQAMIVNRAKRRATGKAVTVTVGQAETHDKGPQNSHDNSKNDTSGRSTTTPSPAGDLVEANRTKPKPKPNEQEGIRDDVPDHDTPAPALTAEDMEYFVDERFVVTGRKSRRGAKGKVKAAPIANDTATTLKSQPGKELGAALKAPRSVSTPARKVHKRRASPEYFGTASEDDESIELVATLQPKAPRGKPSKTAGVPDRVEAPLAQDSDDDSASSGDDASVRKAPTKPPVKWAVVTALSYNEDGKTAAGIMSQRSGKVKSLLSETIAHELPRALLRVNAFPNKYARPPMFLDMLVDASVRLNYTDITERLLSDTKYSTDMTKIPIDRMSSVRGPLYKAARDIAWEAYGLKDLEDDPSAIKKATRLLTVDNRYISPGTLNMKKGKYGDFQPNLPFCAQPIIKMINTLFFGTNAFFPLDDGFFVSSIKTVLTIVLKAGAAIREGLDGVRRPLRTGQGFNATMHEAHYTGHVATLTGINDVQDISSQREIGVNQPGTSKFVNNETAGNDIDDAML